MSRIVIAFCAILLVYYSCGSFQISNSAQHEPEIQEKSLTDKAESIIENFVPSASVLFKNDAPEEKKPINEREKYKERVKDFSQEAYIFAIKHSLNLDYFILIDMKIHSGLNRFFVWDFNKDEVIYSTLVTHGSCDIYEPNEDYGTPKFSNKNNSHCSSLGKYVLGKKGQSVFGMGVKYDLLGLDATNSNATLRSVVLHSWEIVPENEVYPNHIPLSWGCPAVSNNSMIYLNGFIQKQSNKKLLLWVVN